MSVDTNIKGKNLAPYRRLKADEGVEVLVAAPIRQQAARLVITTRAGLLGRRLLVLAERTPGSCSM